MRYIIAVITIAILTLIAPLAFQQVNEPVVPQQEVEPNYLVLSHPGEGYDLPFKKQDVYVFQTPKGITNVFFYETLHENKELLNYYVQIKMQLAQYFEPLTLNKEAGMYLSFLLISPELDAVTVTVQTKTHQLLVTYKNPDRNISHSLVKKCIEILDNLVSGKYKAEVSDEQREIEVKVSKKPRPKASDDFKEVFYDYVLTEHDIANEKAMKEYEAQKK